MRYIYTYLPVVYTIEMEKFTTTRETIQCECGGRRSNIPDVVRRHSETKKHQMWLFQQMSQNLLETKCRGEKVACLLVMRHLVEQ